MREQGYITPQRVRHRASSEPLPAQTDLQPPQRGQRRALLHELGAPAGRRPASAPARAFERRAADHAPRSTSTCSRRREQAINELLPPGSGLPSASLVAIDNRTGEVRAMVGGQRLQRRARSTSPRRASASRARRSSRSRSPRRSSRASPPAPSGARTRRSSSSRTARGKEFFVVQNYEDAYSGSQHARERDDVLRQLGLRRRRASRSARTKIARLARRDGHPHADLDQPAR